MGLDPRNFPQLGDSADSVSLSKDIRSYRGGVNSKSHPTSLPDDQAVKISNYLLKQGALAVRRPGTTNVMDANQTITGSILGLGYWNPRVNPVDRKMVAASENAFWQWTGTGQWTQMSGGNPQGTGRVRFIQGERNDPSFENVGWFVQDGSTEVLEFDGTGVLTVVSGGNTGSSTSVPTCKDAIFWLGRLWVAEDGDQNGLIRYSEIGQPTNFDLSKGFTIDPKDELVRIVQWFNAGILVFNRSSIWVLAIDQANFEIEFFDNTQIEQLNREIGCVAGETVSQAGVDFFFLSRHGVNRLSKTERDKAVGVSVPISDEIESEINRINWTAVDKACATVWDSFYLLSVPVDNSTENNLVLVYDIREEAWTTIEGWKVGSWQVARLNSVEEMLYFGTSDSTAEGKIYLALDESTGLDDGVDVTGSIETARFDFGTTDVRKQFRYIDVFTDGSTGGTVSVYAAPDNDTFQLLGTIDVGVDVLTLPFLLPPAGNPILASDTVQRNRFYLDMFGHPREMQFKFETVGDDLTKILFFTIVSQADEIHWGF